MQNLYRLFAIALSFGLLTSPAAHAQLGVGYPGTTAPRTMLDVNGAISVAETTVSVSSNSGTVPTSAGQIRLTGTATGPITLTSAGTPVAGQQVVIYNASTFPASFNGQNIPVGQAVEFFYSTTTSGFLASAGGGIGNFWGVSGNAGTTPGTQFLGTTDGMDFVAKSNGVERLRIASNGDVSFLNGGVAVDANYQGDATLAHALHFGYVTSGEGISSNRTDGTAGRNQYGLDFYTSSTNRVAITGGGNVGISTTNPNSMLQVNGAESLPYLNSGGNSGILVLDNSHHTVRCFNTSTIDLPNANTCYGRIYTIINGVGQGAFTLTVSGTTGTVYDDLTGSNLAAGPNGFPANTRITIQSDGGDWIVISR